MSDEQKERRNDREAIEYLDKILEIVLELKRMGEKMASDLDTLIADVAEQGTIEDGILTMVNTLVANQANPAKLQALVAGMAANKAKLVAATVAGTPQANTTLVITPSPVALTLGAGTGTSQLKVVDPSGADVTATSAYTSADATKATVSATGLVTAVAAGSTTISVSSGANAGTVSVTTA